MEDILNAITLLGNFVLLPGLTYGSQIALGAIGATLVFSILRFSNFAHGEMMSMGAMITMVAMWGLQSIGVSIYPLPTMLLALIPALAVSAVIAVAIDKSVYAYYRRKNAPPIVFLVASIGIMFVLGGLTRFVVGTSGQAINDGARFIFSARDFRAFTGLTEGIGLRTSQFVTIIVTIAVVIALFYFLNRTRLGKSMRAYSDNRDLALLSGIDPAKVIRITWILAASLATLAGALYALDKGYKPFVYSQLLLPIFAAAILGGYGNPAGALFGGFTIAFSELFLTFAYRKFVGYLVPPDWAPSGLAQLISTDYKLAVSFVILALVLILRPQGIFRSNLA